MHCPHGVNNGVLTKFEGPEEFPEEVMTEKDLKNK